MNNFYKCLVEIYEVLNSGIKIEKFLEQNSTKLKIFLPFNRIAIVLQDFKGMVYIHSLSSEIKTDINLGYKAEISKTSLKGILYDNKPRIINNYKNYLLEHPDSKTTKMLLNNGIYSSLSYPLIANNINIGALIISSTTINSYKEEHIEYMKHLSTSLSIALEKDFFVDDLILASITGFAKLVEAKDSDTGFHIERMQNYSKIIANTLSGFKKYKNIIDTKFIDDIYKFSPLHDIGKVGIADGILLKPGKLTKEEFEVMKMHTLIGAEVLQKSNKSNLRKSRDFFNMGIEIARSHHEQYNGKGYPHGLKGDNIPLSARIVILADVLDALTSKRVYKKAFTISTSLKIIKDEKGKMFDPDIVDAIFEAEDEIIKVYNELNEGLDFSNI
ncbi:MAG: HD domain-containing phosphohydrolase [Clostridiales bacterium]